MYRMMTLTSEKTRVTILNKLAQTFGNIMFYFTAVSGRKYCIRMGLRETGWEDVDWIHLAKDRDQWRALINTIMNFRLP